MTVTNITINIGDTGFLWITLLMLVGMFITGNGITIPINIISITNCRVLSWCLLVHFHVQSFLLNLLGVCILSGDFHWKPFFLPWLEGGSVLEVEEHVREVERPKRSQDGS